jgi:uncharacterized repeat protein (TIGR03803 family)
MKTPGFIKMAGIVAAFCMTATVASPAQTFTSLYEFTASSDPGSLVQGTNGNFYGTTVGGVFHKPPTVFEMTPSGKVATLYRFCTAPGCPDGNDPVGGLVQASNGNFYGATYGGGTGAHCPANGGGCGTVFVITPAGKLTTLYNFCSQASCADGTLPNQLILGINGNLYGTTVGYNGIPCVGESKTGCGTIFEITPAGKLTTLHRFCSQSCADGWGPFAPLTLGTDGNFYGSTVYGGNSLAAGTVFKITPQGEFTTLYAFCAQANCTDGAQPTEALWQASNGNFYGTTFGGGYNNCNGGCGTIFEITPAGQFATLYSFCSVAGCSDGSWPDGELEQGSDGNFYGTTLSGGANNIGSIFEFTPTDQFISLYSFYCTSASCADGSMPAGGLVQATNGSFFGTTSSGGYGYGYGVVYNWSMGLEPFIEAQFNFGKVGHVVTILGNNLKGASGVRFHGTPAKFSVISPTYLKAEVPVGAVTGLIEVTTPRGSVATSVLFQVLP